MGRVKRIWYLLPMRAVKVQASLHIRAVSPEPPLLAHTSGESRGTIRQKTRSLAPLNGWACAVRICHDGMLEDTNSLDAPQMSCVKLCTDYIASSQSPLTFMVIWHHRWCSNNTFPRPLLPSGNFETPFPSGLILIWVLQPIKVISLIFSWVSCKMGKNGRSQTKITWPPASRTWLVSHVTQTGLEPTAVWWRATER